MTKQPKSRALCVVIPFLLLPSYSFACSVAQPASEVVFYDLPRGLPKNASIMLVHFPRAGNLRPGIAPRRAKILKVVRGSSKAAWIDVLVDGAQSGGCRWATTNGKTGYIIGQLRKGEASRIVFDPLYETADERNRRGGIIKADPPSGPPEIKPFYIGTPDWLKRPSEDQLRNYLPKISGYDFRYSVFECGVGRRGELNRCEIIARSSFKDQKDFKAWNDAVQKVLSLYRLKAKTWQGWSVEGGQVQVRVQRKRNKWER
ncbi:MAG: hypothetical protein ACO1NM_02095 [Sphingobium phenoxybenzoativorans]|uniref:hypothetical protein n=1 Tax=Sphingobium phenoxybenzoativorans TaxID=1592790 RepID=UPI001112DC21|nr:hypothetical protein [Sphingobium phenoxybenzoativorans]